mgnify:CR=1 FL=1
MIETVELLAEDVSISAACRTLGIPRSSLYRAQKPPTEPSPHPTPERAMTDEEKAEVRGVLNSERFWDCAPREVYGHLFDEGTYLCHWRTMYRVLEGHNEVQERRDQRSHPSSTRPELKATGPNQLWSWDITYLKGPKGIFFYLYTVIDVYSRYIVGWMIAKQESSALAERLIADTCRKEGIEPKQLTLHADRGSAMRSKTVAQLLIELGVSRSHSRPHTPTDNPYSEAQFKTLKYRPDFPARFGSLVDARGWGQDFFGWYNNDHYHTGLNLMTPAMVHYGLAETVRDQRNQVLQAAYVAHPERFVRGVPTVPDLPREVWINQPTGTPLIADIAHG